MEKRLFVLAIVLSSATSFAQTSLPQNWTASRRQQVYMTAQGSKLIPYEWALALERPDDETLFFADNGKRFGFLPNGSSTGLPVGIVEDTNLDGSSHLGLTCAACHTRDVHFNGTTYRIDGGGADSDLFGFLAELSRATTATSQSISSPKFVRFAKRVLGAKDGPKARAKLFSQLKTFAQGYATMMVHSTPATPWGRSRTDAFGMIFNRVTSIDLQVPTNSRKPDAPVSYPFLWDTSWLNKVQYDGGIPNETIIDRLGRNVGEVLGVFAEVRIRRLKLVPKPVPPIMNSTAKRIDLLALEDWWSELRAPKWSDATALPPIDTTKLKRGQELYNQNCLKCHAMVTPGKRQNVKLIALNDVGTDPGMTKTAATHSGKSGQLEGVWKNLIPFGKRFGPDALLAELTGHVGISVILTREISPSNPSPNGPGSTSLEAATVATLPASRSAEASGQEAAPPETNNDRDDAERNRVRALLEQSRDPEKATSANDELVVTLRSFAARSAQEKAGLEYRARPLDGIWATAPYLHNGSVPTLADLLKPAAQRPKTFFVGDCAITPVNADCVATQRPGAFLFDTSKDGNLNKGHEYAGAITSDEDRAALLEYLKSL